jgi:S-formylglutathione hydrolase FrmB
MTPRTVLAGVLAGALGAVWSSAQAPPASSAQAELRRSSFHSASLGRDVAYAVQLPPSYAGGQRRYPAVYVLHGLFESEAFWERRGLAAIAAELWARGELAEAVVVAVDGGNSFFVNGRAGGYEDLVARDLIAHVEASYRVVPGRGGRALLGVSMGGYAALRLGLAQPALFAAVAAHSAMLLPRPPTPADGAGRWHMTALQAAFGDPIDPELWSGADPLRWAERVDPAAAPALYFDCGAEDRFGFQAGARMLHERLLARGVRHEFALPPGDHGYEYVRTVLPRSLAFLSRTLAAGAAGAEAAGRR